MVRGFVIEESHIVMSRTNEWFSFLVALALIIISFSYEITSAYSHHDFEVLSTEQGTDRADFGRFHALHGNDSLGDAISSSSSSQARTLKEESRSITGTSTRVRSNQHGLIAVSILVEIEERSVIPIVLSSNENNDRCSEEYKRARLPRISDEHDLSIASLRNDIGVIWTVTVEEIQVGGSDSKKEGPNQTPTPYSQLVHLEWKTTKEVNEYAMESRHDTDTDNGFTITNVAEPNSLWQNLIHHSGTANCTFLIPLEPDDSSMSSSLSTRAFLVSLTQTTRLAAPMMSDSLHADVRRNNDNLDDRETTTSVLTRRLAALPRKSNSHFQSTIDPVVDVFLHHSQQQRYHETPDALSKDNDCVLRRERQSTNDDDHNDYDNRSSYHSKKNLRDFFKGESDFLWTLLLLSTMHVMQSLHVGYVMRFIFCFEHTKRLGPSIHVVHSQDDDEGNYQDNTDHDDDTKENINIDKENCRYQEDYLGFNQWFEEAKEKESEVKSIPFQFAPPISSEKNSKKISVEANTCVHDDCRHKDRTKNVNNHDSYNITVRYGDCDDNSNDIEKEHEEGDSEDNSVYQNGDNSLILHEEVPLEDNTTRLPADAKLTAMNSDISPLSGNFLEPLNPKLRNKSAPFDSSQKISFISTIDDRNNDAKATTATTMESSSRNSHMLQVPPILIRSKEMDNTSNNKVLERSFKKLQSRTNLESLMKDSPKDIYSVAHRNNQEEDLDRSSREQLPKEVYGRRTLSCKMQSNESMRSISKATRTETSCNDSSHQIYKHPSKDLFEEIVDENSDAKEQISFPLEFSSELMKSVNSKGPDSSYKCPPHEDIVFDDNLLLKECLIMNSLTTGTGPQQKLSITTSKDTRRKINREIHNDDVLDQIIDVNGLKKGRNEPYKQKKKSPQLSSESTNSVERKSSNQAPMDHHFDMDQKQMKRKDQIQDIIVEGVRLFGNTNDGNVFEMHSSQCSMEGPSKRRQEINAMETVSSKSDSSSSLPSRGQEILTQFSNLEEQKIYEARLCQTDQDSPKKSNIKFNVSLQERQTISTTYQHYKSCDKREGNLGQIQSFSDCKKSQLHQKLEIRQNNSRWKRNGCQGSETEESYVSTLPPDSDYVSDDDPFLLLSRCSRSESQDIKSQENKRKQKKNSTETRSRKKRTLSRFNGLPDEEAMTKDTTSTVMNPEELRNNASKGTDLDSLEVVRVKLPDSLKRRSKRPYSKSNYVADWVPSNELQSISQEFLQEESWAQTMQTSDTKVLRSI